jgi:hypothetical protein
MTYVGAPLALLALLAGTSELSFVTSLGRVTVDLAPVQPDGFSVTPRRVEFRSDDGRPLLRTSFDVGGPYAFGVWDVRLRGLPNPVIVVVSTWVAADHVVVEPALVGALAGRFGDLLPRRPTLEINDAACLYPSTADRPALLTTLDWTGGYCVACWPKPYVVTRYEFDGLRFRWRWQFTSDVVFDGPVQVVSHFGIPCDLDLVHDLESHLVEGAR